MSIFYSVSLDPITRRRRILQLVKNIMLVRAFFKKKFNVDIGVMNLDQMPLHENPRGYGSTLHLPNYIPTSLRSAIGICSEKREIECKHQIHLVAKYKSLKYFS